MQTIIAIIVFALIFISILVMVIIYFTYKGIKKMREAAEDTYFRHQKMKEQKEKNPFGDDYFKSSTNKSQQRNRANRGILANRSNISRGQTTINQLNRSRLKARLKKPHKKKLPVEQLRAVVLPSSTIGILMKSARSSTTTMVNTLSSKKSTSGLAEGKTNCERVCQSAHRPSPSSDFLQHPY